MTRIQQPLLRRWLVLAFLSAFVAFTCALFIATEEAHAKGKADGGGGGEESGGGDPVGDAIGGATKKLGGGGDSSGGGKEPSGRGDGGGDLSGGGSLLGDGSGGDVTKKEGLLSESSAVAEEPKPALADSEPVVTESVSKKASGELLAGATGDTIDPVLKTTSPTLEATKETLEGVAQPVPKELISGETIQPLVEEVAPATLETIETETKPVLDEADQIATRQPAALVEEASRALDETLETTPTTGPLVDSVDGLTSPITDQLGETVQQPLMEKATASIGEALDLVLGNTAEPLLKTAEPLLKPVNGPVLGEVAPAPPTPPLETPLATAPLEDTTPAPVGGGLPALPPTGAPASLLSSTAPPAVPSLVSGAAEGTVLASSPNLAKYAAEASSLVLNGQRRISLVANLGAALNAFLSSWLKGVLEDSQNPLSPSSLPVSGSAFGGFAGSGSGFGLGLLGALALLLALARVNTLLRSLRESFGASSYLQLAIERPG